MPREVHSASTQVQADRTFWCLECEYKCPALVVGVGSAAVSTSMLRDSDGAALDAADEAQHQAEQNAQKAFALTLCPRCGRCDRAALRSFALLSALLAAGGGFAGLFLGLSRLLSAGESAQLVALGLFALGAGFVALLRFFSLRALRRQVVLFPGEAVSEDPSKI